MTTDEMIICDGLTEHAPVAKCRKIAEWATKRAWHRLRELTETADQRQRQVMAEALYEDYCRSCGIEMVDCPGQIDQIMGHIALNKFNFAAHDLLRDDNPVLYEKIDTAVRYREWGKDKLYLHRQRIDNIPLVANTIFRDLVATEQWKSKDAEYLVTRKAAALTDISIAYEDDELFEAVSLYMRTHPYEPLKYSRVGKDLKVPDTPVQRARVKNVLMRMSNPASKTFTDVVMLPGKSANGSDSPSFIWAPGRRRLDAEPANWLRIIAEEILSFLKECPGAGVRDIRTHCKSVLMSCAHSRIAAALGMLEDKKAITKIPGAHNKHHYHVFSDTCVDLSGTDEMPSWMRSLNIAPTTPTATFQADEVEERLPDKW